MANGQSRDYETVAELWVSSKTGGFGSMRKLHASQHRKKNNDKRDSVVQLTSLTEGSPKKLKEKTSWLNMSPGYATTSAAGQWVRVRCHLQDDTNVGTCILTIVMIGEKGSLQHSLHVKMLRATDIRFADRSLFFRSDCLSIQASHGVFAPHSPSLQSLVRPSPDYLGRRPSHQRQQSGGPVLDPIYLAFESKDAVNCWNALLRSYAQPEIYGLNVDQRGLYRMWRQVELTVLNGRNLGISAKVASPDGLTSPSSPFESEQGDSSTEGSPDLEVFCEILLDGLVSGRTTIKKGQAGLGMEPPNWTWHEGFTLSDLPPFGILSIRVWREKKSSKSALVGVVEISLANFYRGQFVEGWFPVLYSIPSGNDMQVGDLRLKMKVDEEIILPSDAYAAITRTLDNRNCLDLLSELDHKMQLGDISLHMLSLAVGRNHFFDDLFELAEREVDNAPNGNTLFRGNTVFTKTVEQAMSFFGKSFLEASVGPCIQHLCVERIEIETDPSRNSKGPKDVEASVKLLPIWCFKFWSQIYQARDQCPLELRRLFQWIRELVERRFGPQASELRWQSVSAFCFLRLIVPAILHPHLFGLHPGLPSPGLQRSLTLIAKAMQSLANLSREQKESHMRGIAGFLEQNNQAMIEYLIDISSSQVDRGHPDISNRYGRLHIMQSLRERARTLSPLTSEAIPVLPHLLDIPKHLAIISSAVIRHARTTRQSVATRRAPLSHEPLVEDFAIKCFEIEATALRCVNGLASTTTSAPAPAPHSRRVSSTHGSPSKDIPPSERIRRAPYTPLIDTRIPQLPDSPHHRRKSSRPSTAPAASSSGSSSIFHTPVASPSLMASPTMPTFHRPSRPSMDSATTSPASSSARIFKVNTRTEQIPVSPMAASSPPYLRSDSAALRRTLSQQQLHPFNVNDNIEASAKRRGGFLRGFLSRSSR